MHSHNSELYNSVASIVGMCSVTEMLSEEYKTTNKMNSNCQPLLIVYMH